MPTFNVSAVVRVPSPGSQVWNGSSYETALREQQINTQVVAGDYFQAKAIVESQYGSNLVYPPVITEAR